MFTMITFQNLSLDPFYNQAFEEVIFETVFDDDVFLLWRNHPAVVVGCYQNICREVRKISGSAQRIARGRLLHHGTLLFQSDLSRLDQITTHHKNDHFKTKGTLSDICTVTNISEHIEHPWSVEQFMEQLLFQVIPDQDHFRSLTKEQEEMVLQLKKEKYESWKWTWGSSNSR